MKRGAGRQFHKSCVRIALSLMLTAGLAHFCRAEAVPDRQTDRPNVVIFFIDDMGYADPACFGNKVVKTPHIDGLAQKGLRLTNFYVNSPICSPSRAALTSGQYPGRWRVHSYFARRASNRDRGMADWLDVKAPSMGRIFKAAGYATAHFGKWHMGGGRDVDDAPGPAAYGFDEHLLNFEGIGEKVRKPRHSFTEQYVDRAILFARAHRDRPFLIRVFPNDVHDPHSPAPSAAAKWEAVTDNPFKQRFFSVLEELDRQIGRVIAEIENLGLTEETIFIFTSDNGPTDWPSYYKKGWTPPGSTGPFFGRKWSLYEGGVRMPFIVQWKGTIPAGQTDDQNIACAIDLLPSLCRMARVDLPTGVEFDGEDRSAVLLGKGTGTKIPRRRPIFWQYGAPYAKLMPGNKKFVSPSLAVRDGRWKLLANPDGSSFQLFDLTADPGETTNLAEAHPKTVESLWRAIQGWTREIGYKKERDW